MVPKGTCLDIPIKELFGAAYCWGSFRAHEGRCTCKDTLMLSASSESNFCVKCISCDSNWRRLGLFQRGRDMSRKGRSATIDEEGNGRDVYDRRKNCHTAWRRRRCGGPKVHIPGHVQEVGLWRSRKRVVLEPTSCIPPSVSNYSTPILVCFGDIQGGRALAFAQDRSTSRIPPSLCLKT